MRGSQGAELQGQDGKEAYVHSRAPPDLIPAQPWVLSGLLRSTACGCNKTLNPILTSTWLYTSSRHQKSFSFTRWVRLAYAKKRVCGSRKARKIEQCDE